MASFSALDIMKMAPRTRIEEEFDSMWMPHWSNYLTPYDVDNLRQIATSKKYAGNMNLKYEMIDNIMKSRGFRRFSGGTNRLVFAHYENPNILAKVAVDKVGMTDNPYEFKAQVLIKPYCTKMLQITDCGTVGFAERVLPITSVKEFKLVADDVLDIIMTKIIGRYIMEDIGNQFYMNWGIRMGFGPVLLDYPYVYELDGAKLYCQNVLTNGMICNHEIDYDAGFNKLVCLGCGKIYTASDLKKDRAMNNIVITRGGNKPMNVRIMRGDEVIAQNYSSDCIKKPDPAAKGKKVIENKNCTVRIVRGDEVITSLSNGTVFNGDIKKEEPEYVENTSSLEIPESEESNEKLEQNASETESGEENMECLLDKPNEDMEGNRSRDVSSEGYPKAEEKEEIRDEKIEGDQPLRPQQIVSSSKASMKNTRRIPLNSGFIDRDGEY